MRLSKIDMIDACALPALRTAYSAILSERRLKIDILKDLNGGLVAMGLPKISNGAFSRWSKKVMAGTANRPEPGLHTHMTVEGISQTVAHMELPPAILMAAAFVEATPIQIRIVAMEPNKPLETVLALSFSGEVLRHGSISFDPLAFDARKSYAIHISAAIDPHSCLAPITDGAGN